jgi:hypothetical protein
LHCAHIRRLGTRNLFANSQRYQVSRIDPV